MAYTCAMAYMEPPVQVDYKDQIMALPIATDEEGNTLYHSLGWAKMENIVVVWDEDGKGWMRGKKNSRYRVIQTYSENPASFTVLKSGKRGR